jgi:hypothetical protein
VNAVRMAAQALALAAVIAAIAFALTGIGARRLDAALAHHALLSARAADLSARFDAVSQADGDPTFPTALAHTGETAAAAALTLQQRIVDLGATHQLTLLTFGAGRTPYQLSTPTVAVELEAQGEWSDAIRFLAAIEALTPRVAVANMTLRALPRASQPGLRAPVSLRVVVWGLYPDGGV